MSLESIKLSELDGRKLKYIRNENLEKITFLLSCLVTKNHQVEIDNERLDSYQLKEVLELLIKTIKSDNTGHLAVKSKLKELKREIEAELEILNGASFISRGS